MPPYKCTILMLIFSALLLISTKVSTLFKDGTIGGDINVVIVGLILLDEDQVSLCTGYI